jgi:hypothetical protein
MKTLLQSLSRFEAAMFIFVLLLLARGGLSAWVG